MSRDLHQAVASFVEELIGRAGAGPVDGATVYGLYLEHWGDEGDQAQTTAGPADRALSPSVKPGAKSAIAKERDLLQKKILRLESESRAIAKRLLDQQTTFATQLNELETQNESLRAYVDKLMCQLITARMEQPALMLAEEEKKRGWKPAKSPKLRRPMSATD